MGICGLPAARHVLRGGPDSVSHRSTWQQSSCQPRLAAAGSINTAVPIHISALSGAPQLPRGRHRARAAGGNERYHADGGGGTCPRAAGNPSPIAAIKLTRILGFQQLQRQGDGRGQRSGLQPGQGRVRRGGPAVM